MRLSRFALISVLVLPFPIPARGQDLRWDIVWDPPILLSDTTIGADSHSPRVTLSGDDIVHVTWTGGAEKWPYARSTNGGETFQRRDILPDTTWVPETFWGRIVAVDSNVLAFAELPYLHSLQALIMARSRDAGSTWEPVRVISDSGAEVKGPSISNDTVAFAYAPPPGIGEIMRSTDLGNTWSRTYQTFHLWTRVANVNGLFHLLELAGEGGSYGLRYRRSHDLGETWEDVKYITPMSSEFLYVDPTITARSSDGGDYVLAAWRDPSFGCGSGFGCTIAGRIGEVAADSTRWFPTRVLTTIPIGYFPELASSKTGFAAVWAMDHESAPFAQVRISDDTSWGVAHDPVVLPARAAIDLGVALSSKAVHAVWEQKMRGDLSYYQIMYRRGRILSTWIDLDDDDVPEDLALGQNYPNPFNPSTELRFDLPEPATVSLAVYDLLGRKVADLASGSYAAGYHKVVWNAADMASGVYLARFSVVNELGRAVCTKTNKLVLIK